MTHARDIALDVLTAWLLLAALQQGHVAIALAFAVLFGVGIAITVGRWWRKPEKRSADVVSLRLVRGMRRERGKGGAA